LVAAVDDFCRWCQACYVEKSRRIAATQASTACASTQSAEVPGVGASPFAAQVLQPQTRQTILQAQ
jgi:hypothetical protein